LFDCFASLLFGCCKEVNFATMYFVRNPIILRWFYPSLIWRIPSKEKSVYLTFDDGPTPGITEFVLDELKKHEAKATFFCIGENVLKHPELFQRIKDEGHTVGNHTMNHLNGWKTSAALYVQDVKLADDLISSRLFRPPYGKIRPLQIKMLKAKFKIVMWDVLSGDFDEKVSIEKCLEYVLKNMRSGSIVVMHDSMKAGERLKSYLPELLGFLSSEVYLMKKIETDAID